ncbi:hypothetical protein PMIN06_013016 [Paraphaeosphaeria minitans]
MPDLCVLLELRPVPCPRSVDCARPERSPNTHSFTFTNYDAASVDQYLPYEPFRAHHHELIESPAIGVGTGAAFSLEAMDAFGLSRTSEFWSTPLIYEQPTSSILARRLAVHPASLALIMHASCTQPGPDPADAAFTTHARHWTFATQKSGIVRSVPPFILLTFCSPRFAGSGFASLN